MADSSDANKEISLLGLREGLKIALPDERRTVAEYQTMANLARRVGSVAIAAWLDRMAQDEQYHYDTIKTALEMLENM